jgi:hypothetical protein
VAGSDDLLVELEFKVESPYVNLDQIESVAVGKPLHVSGTTNREPGAEILICDIYWVLPPVTTRVEWPTPDVGVFSATIDTIGAVPGPYTLEADDGDGHTDTVDVYIIEAEVAFDMPPSVTIGEEVAIRGIVTVGDTIDILIDDGHVAYFDNVPVDEYGEFEMDWDTDRLTPGSYLIDGYIDCPYDSYDEIVAAGIDEDGSTTTRLCNPELIAIQLRNVVAEDDEYEIEGTATGIDDVDIVLIGPGGYPFSDPGLDVANGLYITSTSVTDDEFSEDIKMGGVGFDTGLWIAVVLSPGRDGKYGDLGLEAGDLKSINTKTYFAGKNRDQIVEILKDHTVDVAGSDDLLETFAFKVESARVYLNPIASAAVGEPLYISGTTNREPGTIITISTLAGPVDLPPAFAEVEWPTPDEGVFNATIDTSEAVLGTYTIDADDGDGNTDTMDVEIMVFKKTVIPFPTEIQPMTFISNITFDKISGNVGKNATIDFFTSTEVIDNETYYVVSINKPTGGTKMYFVIDVVNEDVIMKEEDQDHPNAGPFIGYPILIMNLTFDPGVVRFDFPLWVGKTWTTTTNITGRLVNETGVEIPIDTTAVVSGEVTDEVNLTVPYGTFPCVVIEINCSCDVMGQPTSHSEKYWMSQMDHGILFPKSQSYLNGILMEEFELIEVRLIEPGLTAEVSRATVALGDDFWVEGGAPGTDNVLALAIAPKGTGGTEIRSGTKSADLHKNIYRSTVSVSAMDYTFERKVYVDDDADSGWYLIVVLCTGRDKRFGNGESDREFLISEAKGGVVDTYGLKTSSKTQDQMLYILLDATVDVAGSDDLMWIGKVKCEEGKVILDPIASVAVGEPLVVNGTSNRAEGYPILITVTGPIELPPKAVRVTNGTFSATFDTTGAPKGCYTVEADDGDGHRDTAIVEI